MQSLQRAIYSRVGSFSSFGVETITQLHSWAVNAQEERGDVVSDALISSYAEFLLEFARDLFQSDEFLWHDDAVIILNTLHDSFIARGIEVDDREKVKIVLDLILEAKVGPYDDDYPPVPRIKERARQLKDHLGIELAEPDLVFKNHRRRSV